MLQKWLPRRSLCGSDGIVRGVNRHFLTGIVTSLILIKHFDSPFVRTGDQRFMIAVALELRRIEISGLEPEPHGFLWEHIRRVTLAIVAGFAGFAHSMTWIHE